MRAASVRTVSGAVAMALVLAACSGDGDAPTGPAPPPAPAPAEAPREDPRSDAERTADKETAEAALLTIGDFDAFTAFEEPWEVLGGGDNAADGGEGTDAAATGDDAGDDTAGTDAADGDDAAATGDGGTGDEGEGTAGAEESGSDILSQVATCLGLQDGLFGDNPQATSSTFHSPESLIVPLVSAQVTYTASSEDMVQALEVLRREQAPGCFETVVEENLVAPGEEVPADVEFGETTAEAITVADAGDEVVGFRVTTPIAPVQNTGPALDEFGIDLLAELRIVRVGRVGVTMFFQSQIAEFPGEEAQRLTRAVLDRIPADTTKADDEAELATDG